MVAQTLSQRLPGLIGQAAALAGVTVGAEYAANLMRRSFNAISYNNDFRRVLDASPDLKTRDSQQVMDRFRILATLAPTLSKDPTIAAGWIRQTLEFPVITPTVLKDLVSVEESARGLRGGSLGNVSVPQIMAQHMSKGMQGGHDRSY